MVKFVLAFVALWSTAALADDWERCRGGKQPECALDYCAPKRDPEQMLAGCGALIADKGLSPEDRATAYMLRGKAHEMKNEIDAALADENAAIALDPGSIEAYYLRGVVRMQQGDNAGVVADATEALTLPVPHAGAWYADDKGRTMGRPELIPLLILRASAYANSGDGAHAILDANKALELDQNEAEAYEVLGDVYGAEGRYADAASSFTVALKSEPDSVMFLTRRGMAYLMGDHADKAQADFDRAVALDAKAQQALYFRGLLFLKTGRFDRAVADFDRSLALQPDDAYALMGRCDARGEAAKELDKALADCDRALEVDPKMAAAREVRALIHLRRRETALALADAEAAVAAEPKDARALYIRGLAKGPDGAKDKADAAAMDKDAVSDLVGFGR